MNRLIFSVTTLALVFALGALADEPLGTRARISIRLPADARLYLEGKLLEPTKENEGERRSYVTPPLEVGARYAYTVKVEVVRDGRTVSESRDVVVSAGKSTDVDLRNVGTRVAAKSAHSGLKEEPGPDPATPPPPGHGLRGEYFVDRGFNEVGVVRTDAVVNFTNWGKEPPYRDGKLPNLWTDNLKQSWYVHFAARWTGYVSAPFSETYTFHLTVNDGGRLWINDQLIIDAWKEQGATEYTGSIALKAGQRSSLKLLYFNAWFDGQVKLAWSSPSQSKVIIPASQLTLPEPEPAVSSEPVPSLKDHVSLTQVELPGPVKYAVRGGQGARHNIVLAPMNDGTYKLGWNDSKGAAHVSTLTQDCRVTDKEATLADLELRGLVAHDDGCLGILAARKSYQMLALRMDPDGKRIFETVLTGVKENPKESTHLDELWCYHGRFVGGRDSYAAHFAHIEPGGHQGGYFAKLDSQGKKVVEHGWTVSHSLDQRFLFHKGDYYTTSVGDVYPKGIHFENRTLGGGRVIYPPADRLEKWEPFAASLGGMVSAGSHIAHAFLSKEGMKRDVIFQRLDDLGQVRQTVNITSSPDIDESFVRIAPLSQHLLVAWQENENETKLAVVNYLGKFLNEPTIVSVPLPNNDDLVAFPNGDVGWVVAKDGEARVTLVRVVDRK